MPDLLEAIEIETGPQPRAAVILMHGLGADGHDFKPVVPHLGLPETVPVRFVFPHAPYRPVTINRGFVMRAWYDVYDVPDAGGGRQEDAEGVRGSQAQIEALIERERARGIPAGRLFLAGFSQGGAMALHTGLRHSERLAGIIALSCHLPLAGTLAAEASPANRGVPIFIAHGTDDEVIPLTRARHSRDRLLELGYGVTWREYPMPHAVSAEEIRDLAAWLREVLGPRA
ncbi:MAG: carboxylesterase [Candidatus Rokubacteria bacterium]|nr:carboxylesterase [Candidatus Rokubacteria bacterium]